MRIDLHGMTEEDVTTYVMSSLLSFDISSFDQQLEIITGKGWGILKGIVVDILKSEGWRYMVEEGRIIVYKDYDSELNNDISDLNNIFNEWDELKK